MYHVAIYNDHQHHQFRCLDGAVSLRETSLGSGQWEVSPPEASLLGTSQLQLRVADDGVTIDSARDDLQLSNGRELRFGDRLPLPSLFRVGSTWIEVAPPDSPRMLVPVKSNGLGDALDPSRPMSEYSGPAAATVTKWLANAGKLHRAAAGSAEFYTDAARFAVETIGLDAAWVLRRDDSAKSHDWQIVGSHIPRPELGIRFDPFALHSIVKDPHTWYQPTEAGGIQRFAHSIVVAPVLDDSGKLVAAIYGARNTYGSNRRRGIRPLEARLTQLLADSVAVGIARLRQETEATRTRVLLEHAFSPTVAEYIQQNPAALAGQEREVTLMFADLRGYTSLAESMQPTDCYELLGEVMEALTQVVVRHRGVVVDYYGDGLLALWNAPLEQPNHADLACAAAVEMFDALPAVADRWQDQIERPLELGVGIHTGPAFVGNAGTRSRIKYGPRGNAVNVANRVQAASKQLELPLVVTAATQTKLSEQFFTLRVCTAKLPGLEKPAELFTVYPATEAADVKTRLDQYSEALALFEAGELEHAESLLSELAAEGPATPAHFLAHYTAAQRNGNLGRRAVDKYAAQTGPVIEIHSK